MDLTVQIDEPMSMEANAGTGIAYNPVTSVNNKTGAVVLDAEDVGAYELPATGIPESDLSEAVKTKLNKQGTVTDVKKNGISVVVDGVANVVVPTKTSDITNDSGFLTETTADGKYQAKEEGKGLSSNDYTTAEKNKLAGVETGAEANVQSDWNEADNTKDDFIKNKPSIPSKTSDLTNDSNFITNAVNNLTNYYLKSETYTKAEVTALISAIEKVTFRVVATLPATGETNVIYLVPSASSKIQNVKDEYIWVDNAWEKIGSTEVDLSNYYTKTEADAKFITEHQSLSAYRTSSAQDVIDATKVDKVSGKQLSTNDYDDTEKGKVANSVSHIADGTIHVTSQNKTDWNAKSVVSVALTGTATDEVEYITINGVEKKIKSGDEAVWGNITGTLSEQTDLNTVLSDKVSYQDIVSVTGTATNKAISQKKFTDDMDTKANASDLTSHTGNTSNPHSVTKAQVGLSNVPNIDFSEYGLSVVSGKLCMTFNR